MKPNEIILEYPHPEIKRAKIDTFIPPKNGKDGVAIEFKFDRKIPSGRNTPRTQKAGKVFADIFRLALLNFDNVKRYFVYVTDKEMATYFQNTSNYFKDFFDLKSEEKLIINEEYLHRRPTTFIKSIDVKKTASVLENVISTEFLTGFWMRIYRVNQFGVKPSGTLKLTIS